MTLLTFLPEGTIPVLMVLGGLALILQARRLAMTLFTFCGLMIFLPVILEPLLDMLPEWALTLLMLFFWISIPFTILYMIIGRAAWSEMVGTLAAGVVRFCFLLPFRFMGMVFRMLRR
jgi:hypothetical protein